MDTKRTVSTSRFPKENQKLKASKTETSDCNHSVRVRDVSIRRRKDDDQNVIKVDKDRNIQKVEGNVQNVPILMNRSSTVHQRFC